MNKRIIEFIKFLGISVSEFERSCGLSNGTVSKMGDNTRRSTVDKISNKYANLNTSWLITGNGKMLKDENTIVGDDNTTISGNNNHHINANATLEMAIKEISEQRKLVSKSQEQLSKSQEQIDRLITLLEKK